MNRLWAWLLRSWPFAAALLLICAGLWLLGMPFRNVVGAAALFTGVIVILATDRL